jgi:hypothetical protein
MALLNDAGKNENEYENEEEGMGPVSTSVLKACIPRALDNNGSGATVAAIILRRARTAKWKPEY